MEKIAKNMARSKHDSGFSVSSQTDNFIAVFNKKKNDIENNLLKAEQLEKDKLAPHFDYVTEEFQKIQKYVGDSTVFLPFYNLRVAQEALQKLQDLIFQTQDKLLPKKRFAFRKKAKDPSKTASNDETDRTKIKSDSVLKELTYNRSSCGFRNQTGQTLEMREVVNGQDLELDNLDKCSIKIFGSPITLHISNINQCNLFVGPVTTSIFIDNCKDCNFLLACQQLRVHTTQDCNFYLHVTSRAIIEDSGGLNFAPYDWDYDGIDDHYGLSGLDREKNHWNTVDDFNWLSTDSPSPNWHIMNENSRECHNK